MSPIPWLLSTAILAGVVADSAADRRQSASGPSSPAPLCAVAIDDGYGRSPERPVQVGGGLTSGIERERRYLESLRGPQGQRLAYERSGSTLPTSAEHPIDIYSVRYDGQTASLTLYLDIYHFVEPLAPRGLLCGRALSGGLPPVDQFTAIEQLDALAAEIAAAPGFRGGPVDLGGEPSIGTIVDRFRVRSRRARMPSVTPKAASSVPPVSVPVIAETPGTTVVAFPQTCGARTVSPSGVSLIDRRGFATEPQATFTDTAAVRALVPGQDVPGGSVGATFAIDALLAGWQVRVTFAGPACAASPTRESALDFSGPQVVESPMPLRPADDTSEATWVVLQAIVDHQGAFQQVRALGGPPALVRAAEDAVRGWKARPARVNGAPVAVPVVVQVDFGPRQR